MGWDSVPSEPGTLADHILGRNDFEYDSTSEVYTASTVDAYDMVGHADHLIVAANTRVLVYDLSVLETNMPASFVAGQSSFSDPDFDVAPEDQPWGYFGGMRGVAQEPGEGALWFVDQFAYRAIRVTPDTLLDYSVELAP